MTSPSGSPNPLMPIWLSLGVLWSLFVGSGAGVLTWMAGQSPATAILAGGAAFGGTLALAILIICLFRR